MGLSIEDLEALHQPGKNTGMIPLLPPAREVHEHRFATESYPNSADARTTVMGPVKPPLRLPGWVDWRCGIHHFDSRCTCSPPLIHNPVMAETAVASGRYVIGALHKVPVPGSLTQEDLDFLAWSCAKLAAHWGRLALGQENLT